ncbi:hypothetical protein CTAYLR_009183 [Chrysophaeum taylorii]|uniref:RRM domain-containing protein n=1 Tax=Chrysophaeum taylorii TaxID=2483200 RepID=A0AAD7UJM9_9STRA|nr:hypothetical protein CTAYLR_009183 [Chrysophaeum taylorii]
MVKRSMFDVGPDGEHKQHESVVSAMAVAKALAEQQQQQQQQGFCSAVASTPRSGSGVLAADRERAMRALERNLEIVAQKEEDFDDEEPSRVSFSSKVEKFPQKTRAGIGAKGASKGAAPQQQNSENASCYVSGLPVEAATEAALQVLFSPYGRVKRVKVYVDNLTDLPKGDALVTFAKPGSVGAAVAKLDGYEVAKGAPLKVSQATFHSDSALAGGAIAKPSDDDWPADPSGLPAACRAALKPVVLLRHLYDPAQCKQRPGRDFLDELEAEIAAECAKFGSVSGVHAPKASAFEGAVAVTFDTLKAAELCACAMTGRWFDNVQIVVERLGNWDDDLVANNNPRPKVGRLAPDLAPDSATVALVRNAYTDDELAQGGERFLPDLEAEMRSECLKYGDVLSLATRPSDPALAGTVVVAFADPQGFERCRADLDGRWFDYRRLKVEKYDPPPPPAEDPRLDDFFRDLSETTTTTTTTAAATVA